MNGKKKKSVKNINPSKNNSKAQIKEGEKLFGRRSKVLVERLYQ